MLNTLEEKAGLVLTKDARTIDAEALSMTDEVIQLSDKEGNLHVTICPGYTEMDGAGLANLETAFAAGDCDTLMSAFHAASYLDKISEKEKSRTATLWLVPSTAFLSRNSKCSRKRIPLEMRQSIMFAENTLPWQVLHLP